MKRPKPHVQIATIGAALAVPARVYLLLLLADRGPLNNDALLKAQKFTTQSGVSRHLVALEGAGLIGRKKVSAKVINEVSPFGRRVIKEFMDRASWG